MNHIMEIALLPFPLRSMDEYVQRIRKNGGASLQQHETAVNALRSQMNQGELGTFHVHIDESSTRGKYCTIVEACLVVMKKEIDRRIREHNPASSRDQPPPEEVLKSREMRISLQFLLGGHIDQLLLPQCPANIYRPKPKHDDGGLAFYLDPATRSAEYGQIRKLASNKYEYIKERSQSKETVFEMTPKGWKAATMILQQRGIYPAPLGPYRTSHILSVQDVKPEFQGICLGMDFREGGVQKNVLHKMCNGLDMTNVPYFVGCLDIGDYCFFDYNNKLLPILVERKSVQDLAFSMSDGRWVTQKQKMYHGQYVFGYDNCRMAYIIEGKEEKQTVRCEQECVLWSIDFHP